MLQLHHEATLVNIFETTLYYQVSGMQTIYHIC